MCIRDRSFINVNKKKQNKKEPGIAVSFIRSSKYKLLQTLTNFVREGGKERERNKGIVSEYPIEALIGTYKCRSAEGRLCRAFALYTI